LPRQDPDELLSPADAAKLLKLSVDRVRTITDRGRLSFLLTPGGRCRYRRGDIERVATEWVRNAKQRAKTKRRE
jgi:hypothetical protein